MLSRGRRTADLCLERSSFFYLSALMVITWCSASSPVFCTQLHQTQIQLLPSGSEATLIHSFLNCWHFFAGDSKAHTSCAALAKVKPYITACHVDRKRLPSWSDNYHTSGFPAAASYPTIALPRNRAFSIVSAQTISCLGHTMCK